MSKKNYVAIAEVFAGEVAMARHLYDSDISKSAKYSLKNVIVSLADVMARDNYRFNRDKFYAACGMEWDKDWGWRV